MEKWGPSLSLTDRTFCLLKKAGSGGFGNVWKATTKEGRNVALKWAHETAASELLSTEAEVAVLALSPRLPELVDAGWMDVPTTVAPGTRITGSAEATVGARPYVAFAWVDGDTLANLPSRSGDSALTAALMLAADAAEALADLHGIGAAHGDVKPQNLVIDGEGRAHVIDLGLCCAAFSRDVTGATPRYLSRNDSDLGDARARDLLALGVVLAERMGPNVRAASDAVAAARPLGQPAPHDEICGALLSQSPAARPGARWVATSAAAALQHRHGREREEREERDVRAVRASYLRLRRHELADAKGAAENTAPWLAEAITLTARARSLATAPAASFDLRGLLQNKVEADADAHLLGPLSVEGFRRWMVLLCGPHAAPWPLRLVMPAGEASIAQALLVLARRLPPEAWTFRDVEAAVAGADEGPKSSTLDAGDESPSGMDPSTAAALAIAVSAVPPNAAALARVERERSAPAPLVLAAADALRRSGDLGRAKNLVLRKGVLAGRGARGLAAEVLRRAGDLDHAKRIAEAAIADGDDETGRGRAALARIALDTGRGDDAVSLTRGATSAHVAEVAALVALGRGEREEALAEVARAEALARTPEEHARLSAVRGMSLHMIDSEGAFAAFSSAVEYAMRAGAVIEEATYRTGLASAAVDLGDLGVAVSSARRASVLWEVLGRPALAARALLACAAAHAMTHAPQETRAASFEAATRAREAGESRTEAFALWALADALPISDREAKAAVEAADDALKGGSIDDVLGSSARLWRHGSAVISAERKHSSDEVAADPGREIAARLSWWGARAERLVRDEPDVGTGASRADAMMVVNALLPLCDARAPVWAAGPAMYSAHLLSARIGLGDVATRFLAACRETARALLARTPADLSARVRALPWVEVASTTGKDAMAAEQIGDLERILRSLSDRERLGPLLDRALDALVLWTGVERGLLLMRAPDGRLRPRAARNLARADLVGEQLALSHTLAERALSARAPVVAVDAEGELSTMVQSVHALRLRSVMALPLIARGEVLGVVYLDDRLRKGAFGPRELSWAQTIAQLAAVAILDARTNVLLRRAALKARRAQADLAVALARREAEVDSLARELTHQKTGRATRHRYDKIIGESEEMQKLLGVVDRVSASDVPVLILGESGCGKELLARAIHENGQRSSRPFVGENCAAIPEGLLESTLFGHVRGAFTGADRPRAGLFDVADRGTLFLDEVGEMSLAMQTRLLRILEDGMVRPVGSEKARKVDVRVLAATHRDLAEMVKTKAFREDLYYRLNIVPLRIPPLRARPSDIPLLVSHFIKAHAGGVDIRVTKAALAKLLAFPWPGNIRQLENEIRRAIVLGDGAIDVAELSPEVAGGTGQPRGQEGFNVRDRIDALEVELVNKALEKTKGNQTQAAKLLGLSRFGLQKMMKRLQLRVD